LDSEYLKGKIMTINRFRCFSILLFTVLSIGLTAAPVSGVVNITGSAGVSATAIDFFGDTTLGCSAPGLGTEGCFLANAPLSGDFTTLVPATISGTIQDLQGPPISGAINFPSFISFNNGIVFNLTTVFAGGAPDCATVDGNAANVSCTPVVAGQVSPFVLTNSSNGANASVFFNVAVDAYTGSSATGTTYFLGAFNTPSAGTNIAGILAQIAGGGTISAAYSANFVGQDVVIPEPGTGAMMGIAALALLFGGLRSKTRPRS
jgi:hypothetical protein